MKNINKIVAITLAALIGVGLLIPLLAAPKVGAKEEVVYGNLKENGQVDGIYVVNILDTTGGAVADYGDYSAIRNMTTTDTLTSNDGMVSGTTTAEKLYYEGKMKANELPWNVEIAYLLDGKGITGAELGGKSGKLEISVKVTQNTKVNDNFYNSYALQTSITLDTKRCQSIVAEGATVANAGSKKMLNYTGLPGTGQSIKITADVQDFAMDGIAINGVKMALDLDISALGGDLSGGIAKLQNGVAKLDTGAKELAKGASGLDTGVDSIKTGADQLKVGLERANKGLDELRKQSGSLTGASAKLLSGITEIQKSLDSMGLTSQSLDQLVAGSSKIAQGIDELEQGIGGLAASVGYNTFKEVMKQQGLDIDVLIKQNADNSAQLKAMLPSLAQVLPKEQLAVLEGAAGLLAGNNQAIGGVEGYLGGLSNGAKELHQGGKALTEQYGLFDTAINQLSTSLGGLAQGMTWLSAAINGLVEGYGQLDSGLTGYTQGVAQLVSGYNEIYNGAAKMAQGTKELKEGSSLLLGGAKALADGTSTFKQETSNMVGAEGGASSMMGGDLPVISFASEQNREITTLQFVIKAPGISEKLPEAVVAPEPVKLNLWQKFIKLFGF